MPPPDSAPQRPERSTPVALGDLAARLGLWCQPQDADCSVAGVTHASGDVQPGDLYVAVAGARTHGARFAADAAQRGAVAVLTDDDGRSLAAGSGLPVLVTGDPRAMLGPAAALVYAYPGEQCAVVGVTGTNGKTTVTTLLHAVLTAALGSAGLIGTIETRIGDAVIPSVRTTPEAGDLHALLAVMAERGVPAVAVEVSSHALALHRVGGLVCDVAGFTNLSQDHLDFHLTMEHYFATKARLFSPAHSRRGVVVVDDPWGRRLVGEATIPLRTVAAFPDDARAQEVLDADWRVSDVEPVGGGSRAELHGPDGRSHELRVPMPGLVNVANAALTVALAAEVGVDPATAVEALAEAPMVAGRMERVSGQQAPIVVVDYAHSADALDMALATLRGSSPAPLVVLVGAGGDRDRTKRAPMGRAAAQGADIVVVTDDNPRSEDPAAIRAQVRAGADEVDPTRVHEVADRGAAIRRAISLAGQGTVLLAGKGHEQGQDVAGVVHPFDDRVEARAALDDLLSEPAQGGAT